MVARGFSLLELLIVIVIITVLMAMLLTAISAVREHAKHTAAAQVIAELQVALENYRAEDMRHKFPIPEPEPSPFMRRDPAFAGSADPTLRTGPNPTRIIDQLADCGFSWRTDQMGGPGSVAPDCLLDPWRRPYRYAVDAATTPGPQAWRPAPLADWNSGNARPFAYVWSIGTPVGAADAEPATARRWVYRRDGKVR